MQIKLRSSNNVLSSKLILFTFLLFDSLIFEFLGFKDSRFFWIISSFELFIIILFLYFLLYFVSVSLIYSSLLMIISLFDNIKYWALSNNSNGSILYLIDLIFSKLLIRMKIGFESFDLVISSSFNFSNILFVIASNYLPYLLGLCI